MNPMRTLALVLSLSLLAGCGCGGPEIGKPDTVVYVTKGGEKYHRRECRLKQGSHGITLAEAVQRYEPCSVCKPPILKKEN